MPSNLCVNRSVDRAPVLKGSHTSIRTIGPESFVLTPVSSKSTTTLACIGIVLVTHVNDAFESFRTILFQTTGPHFA